MSYYFIIIFIFLSDGLGGAAAGGMGGVVGGNLGLQTEGGRVEGGLDCSYPKITSLSQARQPNLYPDN